MCGNKTFADTPIGRAKQSDQNVSLLQFAARHGRALLVLGLVVGAGAPTLAEALRPWLPEFVAILLMLTALRVGHKTALGSLTDLPKVVLLVLGLQLVMPLAALAGFALTNVLEHPFALAVVLMLAAPSVTGAPNFLIMMGQDPALAMRILIIGTAAFPITALPVLWGLPALDGDVAASATLRLIAVILCATALGFAIRHSAFGDLSNATRAKLDGLSAIALSVIVVGLMSEIGPMLRADPIGLLWVALAVLALNFGLQVLVFASLRRYSTYAAAIAIVTGNRNVALFLIALPPDITGPLLVFIGCYQIPMYLTPIVMKRVYRLTL